MMRISFLLAAAGISTGFAQTAISTNTVWMPIGPWNMLANEFNYLDLGPTTVAPANIAEMSVAIRSDALSGSNVWVDDLGCMSTVGYITGSGARGGYFHINPAAPKSLILWRGRYSGVPNSAYPNGFTLKYAHSDYNDAAINRGWVKLNYLGNPVNFTQPYAVKSRIVALGPWNLEATANAGSQRKTISLKDLGGIDSRRVMSVSGLLASDPVFNTTGILSYNNMRMLHLDGGTNHPYKNEMSTLNHGWTTSLSGAVPNGNAEIWAPPSMQTGTLHNYVALDRNRGFVRIDYLAAQCADGNGGYVGQNIPIAKPDNCNGRFANPANSAEVTHVIQSSGDDIFGTADDFYLASKSGLTGNRTVIVRVDKVENTAAYAKSGIMLRLSMDKSSAHASMLVTPGAGAHFTWRPSGANQATQRSANNSVKAPCWLKLVKSGNTITGSYSTDGVNYTQAGTTTTVAFGTAAYLGGLAAASNSANLATSSFTQLSGL